MADNNPQNRSNSVSTEMGKLMKRMKSIYTDGISFSIPNPMYAVNATDIQRKIGIDVNTTNHYYSNSNSNKQTQTMANSTNNNSLFQRIRSMSVSVTIPVPSIMSNNNNNNSLTTRINNGYKSFEKSLMMSISNEYDICNDRFNQYFGRNGNNNNNNNNNGMISRWFNKDYNQHLIEFEIGWNLDYFF